MKSGANIEALTARLRQTPLATLFAQDGARAARFTKHAAGLTLDLSRQRIDAAMLAAFESYAVARDFVGWRARMFAGEIVNTTEKRAARHVALRAPDAPAEVQETRARMRALAAEITAGRLKGATGEPITSVLHLGIGGSDLGPRLVFDALRAERNRRITLRFASNVDQADFDDAVEDLDPARTLVVIVSKTFTTLETLANAGWARDWGADAGALFAAVSAAPERAKAWGVAEERIFPFWDWVGGRYSLWSAVGLSNEIALKPGTFDRFLAGAHAMDAHFHDAPFGENLPFLAAAVQAWNREALGHASYAIAPYAHRLHLLPAYLQQLEMESNGKSVTRDGAPLARSAAAITWGAAGTNAQHSFFQLLHQGVGETPVEFVIAADAGGAGRTPLLANALAQAQALMHGKTADAAFAEMRARGVGEAEARALAPHRAFPGDRASTILGLDDLSPESLGALLAFYEHRTAAQAFLAGINPFDQYGVELGKEMANALTPAFAAGAPLPPDPATAAWVERLRS